MIFSNSFVATRDCKMPAKLKTTDDVHRLFKAFYDHNLPNKKVLCEELRDLINTKMVDGKGTIQKMLQKSERDRWMNHGHGYAELYDAIILVAEKDDIVPDEVRINIQEDHANDDLLPVQDAEHLLSVFDHSRVQNMIAKYMIEIMIVSIKRLDDSFRSNAPNFKEQLMIALVNLQLCIDVLKTTFGK